MTEQQTEELSARIHQIWARWFLHYSKNATQENMRRWTRLAHTDYNDLPEEEKQKDREILKEILASSDNRKFIA